MDKPGTTSEEKLLNLIRHQQRGSAGPAPVQAEKKKGGKFNAFTSDVVLLKYSNILLSVTAVVFLGLLGYVGVTFFVLKEDRQINNILSPNVRSTDNKGEEFSLQQHESVEFYEQSVRQRDIFQENQGKKAGAATSLADLGTLIRVVGIVVDEDSKVILEDTKTGQTAFKSIGESTHGAVIKKIYSDRVVFEYADTEVELRP